MDEELGQEQFRRIFEASPVGIALADGEWRILRANDSLCRFLGCTEGDLLDRRLTEVTHPADAGLDGELARRLLAGEIPRYAIEKRYLRSDGEVVWGRLQASLAGGEHGQPFSFVGIVEDITEEREVAAAHQETGTLKDAFIRVVAHDLQNPLVAIAGLARLLAESPADLAAVEQRQILGRIAIHAERLERTVAGFVTIDRLRQGAVTVRPAPTNLVELAERVARACDPRDHPLSLEAIPVVVPIDPEIAERILANLLDNAVSHTPPGTPVWIRVAHDPGGLTLEVEDAGPGMPDELRAAGFELFRTGDPNARRTGAGLWVVARLAELHGGRAWVGDRPGGGASFRVTLATEPPSPG